MKSVALMKQRLLYKREGETEDFLKDKTTALAMKDTLAKVAGFLKAWLEGLKSLQKASREMSAALGGEDAGLDELARTINDCLADTQSGAGIIEVALDSVNQKMSLLNELKKRCDTLDTAHLELSRASRKMTDQRDPVKQAPLKEEKDRCQEKYDTLKAELDASFRFFVQEASAGNPSGLANALGLVSQEIMAVKASQIAFFKTCNDVVGRFPSSNQVNAMTIWSDFQDRRMSAVEGSVSQKAQSGRNLFREGLNDSSSSRMSSSRMAPPPPPPPPPAPAKSNGMVALYDYSATGDDELSFCAGANLVIVDQSDPNWWTAQDKYGRRGLVPSNYLQ
jgi:hypothetical protein